MKGSVFAAIQAAVFYLDGNSSPPYSYENNLRKTYLYIDIQLFKKLVDKDLKEGIKKTPPLIGGVRIISVFLFFVCSYLDGTLRVLPGHVVFKR